LARFTLLVLLVLPRSSDAGAWTVRRGHFFLEGFWQRYVATRDFGPGGERIGKVNDGRFREFRNELKLELPTWDDRLNILLSAPFDFSSYHDRNVTLTNAGAEEATVGTKWRLNAVRAPVVVAVQTSVNFGLGCDVSEQPPLGDCQTDVDGRLVASRSLRTTDGIISAYFTGELGYRFRRDAPTDELPYFVEVASQLGSSVVWLKGFVDGVQARSPGSSSGQEEDYSKWSASVMIGRDPTTRDAEGRRPGVLPLVEVGVGGVFAGRNTGVGHTVFVKFALQR
jgi:hypothetical protein